MKYIRIIAIVYKFEHRFHIYLKNYENMPL